MGKRKEAASLMAASALGALAGSVVGRTRQAQTSDDESLALEPGTVHDSEDTPTRFHHEPGIVDAEVIEVQVRGTDRPSGDGVAPSPSPGITSVVDEHDDQISADADHVETADADDEHVTDDDVEIEDEEPATDEVASDEPDDDIEIEDEEPVTDEAASDEPDDHLPPDEVDDDAPPATSSVTPDAVAQALAQGREEGRRDTIRGMAGAVSAMSIGALVTLLVLSLTGQLGGSSGLPPRTAVTPPPSAVAGAPAPQSDGLSPPAQAPADTADPQSGAGEPDENVPDAQPAANIQVADPTRISIPAIGVDADVIPLQVLGGELQVPGDFAQTGWWEKGPEPGEVGPSVVVGHVDSSSGPAVFFDLRSLRFNDQIIVTREDGSTAIFAVRASSYVDKEAFPTDLVYGDTDKAELRLITCDGDFEDGSYLGNLIVFAEQIGETAPLTAATGI